MVPINYVAIFTAAVASMIIGAVWYGPLFGKMWISQMGWTSQQMDSMKAKGMAKNYIMMFIGSLIMSYVLVHSLTFAATYLKIGGINAGIQAGLWNWLGFVAPVTLGSVLWEGKNWKLWMINNGYYIVSLPVMGTVLSVLA